MPESPTPADLAAEAKRLAKRLAEQLSDTQAFTEKTDDSWLPVLTAACDAIDALLAAATREPEGKMDQAVTAPADESSIPEPAPYPEGWTDERIDHIADLTIKGMKDGMQGFCREWGWRQFARALLRSVTMPGRTENEKLTDKLRQANCLHLNLVLELHRLANGEPSICHFEEVEAVRRLLDDAQDRDSLVPSPSAQPAEPKERKPLTDAQVEALIAATHFDPSYKRHASDETCLRWYYLGLRDGERAHGIQEQPKESKA